ncbi:hypothetical protein AAE02nite_33140 [Adhaeribacter aerolatus]|uniref:Uncharacterized protein n=1 Tax=Adhaeribacter aerolatus TaxID=670289 RepID=A0A512B108_9BACT|nr:hypothetical protein AAE02nite_33140 [Adhaeribacter aerolatus]
MSTELSQVTKPKTKNSAPIIKMGLLELLLATAVTGAADFDAETFVM